MTDTSAFRRRVGGLGGIEIFQELSTRDLAVIEGRCTWRRYLPGQLIVGHEDTTQDVFLIAAGTVRAVIYSSTGKEITFRDIDAGQVFGEYAAIDGGPRSANVVARTEAVIASMPAETFRDILAGYAPVALATLCSLTGQIRQLSERVFEFSTMAVNNRIHAELLRLARLRSDADRAAVIAPAPTHAEIASRISTHREAVTRELNRLERIGLIERGDGAWRIPDVGGLERLVRRGYED